MLLLQKLLLENSKLYSFQSQRNYYFDYSQSFIIRTEKKYETAGKFQITLISNFLIAHSTKLLLNLASLDTDTKSYSKFHARVFRSLAFAGNVSDFVPSDVLQELLITLCRALRTSRAPLFDRRRGKRKRKERGRGEEKKKTREREGRIRRRRVEEERSRRGQPEPGIRIWMNCAAMRPYFRFTVLPSTLGTLRRLSTVFSSLRGRGGI